MATPSSTGALESSITALQEALAGTATIVFDLDGTVYDTRDFERPALAAVADWLRETSGRPLPAITADLWSRRESDRHRPGLFDEVLLKHGLPREWGRECLQRFHAHPGAELAEARSLKDCLRQLRATGHRLALVSNGLEELQSRKVRYLKLADVFDHCIFCGPQHPERQKPAPWAWTQLARWRGDAPALYVGDDPVDEQFAAAGQAGFVGFQFRSPSHEH